MIFKIYKWFLPFSSSFECSNQIKHSCNTEGTEVNLLGKWTKRKRKQWHKLPAFPLSLCQMADRLSLRRDMTYGAHRVHDSAGAQPHLPHPGESQGNRCGCQGIILMNLDIIPTSAALVCGHIFYNFSSTFAFQTKQVFHCISILIYLR